jgi:hypothetical protein
VEDSTLALGVLKVDMYDSDCLGWVLHIHSPAMPLLYMLSKACLMGLGPKVPHSSSHLGISRSLIISPLTSLAWLFGASVYSSQSIPPVDLQSYPNNLCK